MPMFPTLITVQLIRVNFTGLRHFGISLRQGCRAKQSIEGSMNYNTQLVLLLLRILALEMEMDPDLRFGPNLIMFMLRLDRKS